MVKSFQSKGSPVKKVDTIDTDGNPVCVVTYRSGLTENSAVFDGPCSDYSDEEIEEVVREVKEINLILGPTEMF